MASLTVRQLDEALKKRLRLRAARNGRSVEDEVRTILRSAATPHRRKRSPPRLKPTLRQGPRKTPAAPRGKLLLIIGGGIAAYKSLDLIRRLRERGIAVRVFMTDAAQKFITPLSAGALAGEPPSPTCSTRSRARRRPYPARTRHRPRDRRARDRRPDGQDGERPRRRSRLGGAARDRPDDAARAGDEPAHVVEHAATRRNLAQLRGRRRRSGRAERGRDGREQRGRHRPHGRAARDRRRGRGAACAARPAIARWRAGA